MTRPPRLAWTPRTRKTLLMALALAAVFTFAGQTVLEGVEARWSADSAVAGNEFIATKHTPVGAYRLAVLPEDGERLRPGQQATVEVALLPDDAESVTLDYTAGDELVHELTLPAYLTPIETDGTGWEATRAGDGSWRATHTRLFDTDTEQEHTADERLRLTVAVAPRAHDALIRAEAALPSQFTSTHALAETSIASQKTAVDIGVYDLNLTGGVLEPGDEESLSFRTLPDESPEVLGLRAGDVISHVITYSAGLTHVDLPGTAAPPGMSIRWSSDGSDTLTRTLTVTDDTLEYHPETVEVPIVQAGLSLEESSVLTVRIELPEDLVSAQPLLIIDVAGIPVLLSTTAQGDSHSLVLTQDGQLFSWGSNGHGELGNGHRNSRSFPSKVDTDLTFERIYAGHNTSFAWTSDGSLYAWGRNTFAQLGFGHREPVLVPTRLGLDFVQLQSSSQFYSFGLTAEGAIWRWGNYGNPGSSGWGFLTPELIPSEDSVVFREIAAGEQHVVALTEDGRVYGMGGNYSGELGTGDNERRDHMVPAQTDVTFASISAGYDTTLALTQDGIVYAWGEGRYGVLGSGDVNDRNVPTRVSAAQEFAQISNGRFHALAIGRDGRVFAWGQNGSCQAGLGSPSDPQLVPAAIESSLRFGAVQAGQSRSLALGVDGKGYAWGANNMYSPLGVVGKYGVICTPQPLF